jgi:hypothetical protein
MNTNRFWSARTRPRPPQVRLTYPCDPCNSVVKSSLASPVTDDNFCALTLALVPGTCSKHPKTRGYRRSEVHLSLKWIKRPTLKSSSALPSFAVASMLVPSTEPKDQAFDTNAFTTFVLIRVETAVRLRGNGRPSFCFVCRRSWAAEKLALRIWWPTLRGPGCKSDRACA